MSSTGSWIVDELILSRGLGYTGLNGTERKDEDTYADESSHELVRLKGAERRIVVPSRVEPPMDHELYGLVDELVLSGGLGHTGALRAEC